MKKLLLAVLTFVSAQAFAQDLSIGIVQPTAGTTITGGQAFNITIQVGNVSGSDINIGDSVIIGLYLDNTIMTNSAGQNLVLLYRPSIAITAGQAVNVTLQGGVTAIINETKSGANFCAVGLLRKAGSVDPDNTNNTGCQLVNTVSGSSTGVNENNVNLTEVFAYPNPATNYITVNHNLLAGSGKIVVLDITGKQITTTEITKDKTDVDVTSLNTGIYIYQVVDLQNRIIKSDKFIVNK